MITIRPATDSDLTSIVLLLANDKLGAQREDATLPLNSKYTAAFARIDADENQELMVLDHDGEVVGCFQLTFIPYLTYQGGTRAQIEGVRIHERMRGQGLGEQAFRWAIERARGKGAHLLQLTTDKQRPDALRFYEKLGFVASHEGMKLKFPENEGHSK